MKQMPTFEGILVEHHLRNVTLRASGLLINGTIFITSGSVLAPLMQNEILRNIPGSIYDALDTTAIIETRQSDQKTKSAGILKKCLSERTENNQDRMKDSYLLVRKKATLIHSRNCTELSEVFRTSLFDWATIRDNKKEKYKDYVSRDKYPEIFTSFLFYEIFEGNRKNSTETLSNCMKTLRQYCQIGFGRGDKICLETTPFGSTSFINSYSEGMISAVVEPSNCLFLTDASAAPGSEGGPIFKICTDISNNFQKIPIGIVLSSISFWKDEWVGFTLGVTLKAIIGDKTMSNPIKCDSVSLSFPGHVDQSIVKIYCGAGWGSGVLVNKDEGLIVTSSHVVKHKSNIKCFWMNEKFRVGLLYRTKDNKQYDIAVLKANPKDIHKMKSMIFSKEMANKGEPVIAFGFPFFDDSSQSLPTVSRGSVAQCCRSMIQTTCCIQPGASGGAIVRPTGELLGIIVCNTASDDTQMSFPNINMSVPAYVIDATIKRYLVHKNVLEFNDLEVADTNITKKWNLLTSKL